MSLHSRAHEDTQRVSFFVSQHIKDIYPMSYLLKSLEDQNLKENAPNLRVGDTVKVHNRIVEGNNERVQVFQGTVIGLAGAGPAESRHGPQNRCPRRGRGTHLPPAFTSCRKDRGRAWGTGRRAKLYFLAASLGKKGARLKQERR